SRAASFTHGPGSLGGKFWQNQLIYAGIDQGKLLTLPFPWDERQFRSTARRSAYWNGIRFWGVDGP
ncbi:MAG: hypothetical protein WBM60_06370, partial [Eudoraea sp.]